MAGPLIGLIVQVALLTALAVPVGLGLSGWLAGLGFGLVTCGGLLRGLRVAGAAGLGPADRVTLARATLVGAVTALVARSFTHPVPVGLLVGLAAVALALDAVDGKVARRTGTVSALGARFDMEVDAFLILVLCLYDARLLGSWVVAIGAMRYAFVAASRLAPWLRGALPARLWRKTVAAVQGVVLAAAAADLPARPVTVITVAVALALLIESFGRDVLWLWRHRRIPLPRQRRAPVAGPPQQQLKSAQRPQRPQPPQQPQYVPALVDLRVAASVSRGL
jgi:phosphatidylglycerophosphate synthase